MSLCKGYRFDDRPGQTGILDQAFALLDIDRGPGLAGRHMIKRGDDTGSTGLSDLFERDRVIWPEPAPGFFHSVLVPRPYASSATMIHYEQAIIQNTGTVSSRNFPAGIQYRHRQRYGHGQGWSDLRHVPLVDHRSVVPGDLFHDQHLRPMDAGDRGNCPAGLPSAHSSAGRPLFHRRPDRRRKRQRHGGDGHRCRDQFGVVEGSG